jgi:hypothetical protein
MFDAVVVRRTTVVGSDYPLDLGRLAEAMLFYRTVRLALTRGSVTQLLRQCGPDVALEIVSNPCIDAMYVSRDLGVLNEGVGTPHERHRPCTIRLADSSDGKPEPHDVAIVRMFQDNIGKPGKGRRMARRFLEHVRSYQPSDEIIQVVRNDWQDSTFMREALKESISYLAPSYPTPPDLQVTIKHTDDDFFIVESDLDWPALQNVYLDKSGTDKLTAGHLLVGILDMREDLQLSATFGAGIAQDPLGAALMRAKCADLTAALEIQQARIDQFQDIVVAGLADLRGVVNSGECSFSDVLGLIAEADHFRDWLDSQTPDSDLIKSYFDEVTKKRWIDSRPVKELRWLLPIAAGSTFALHLPEAALIAPSSAGGLALADRFLVSRLASGWRPASFIDTKLRPFVSR